MPDLDTKPDFVMFVLVINNLLIKKIEVILEHLYCGELIVQRHIVINAVYCVKVIISLPCDVGYCAWNSAMGHEPWFVFRMFHGFFFSYIMNHHNSEEEK